MVGAEKCEISYIYIYQVNSGVVEVKIRCLIWVAKRPKYGRFVLRNLNGIVGVVWSSILIKIALQNKYKRRSLFGKLILEHFNLILILSLLRYQIMSFYYQMLTQKKEIYIYIYPSELRVFDLSLSFYNVILVLNFESNNFELFVRLFSTKILLTNTSFLRMLMEYMLKLS